MSMTWPTYEDYDLSRNCPTEPIFMATRYGCHIELGLEFDQESSLTEQHHQQSCDVNYIVQQAMKHGFAPDSRGPGEYIDVSNTMDYHEALNFMQSAQDSFMDLPSAIRSKFDNDPGAFLNFVDDPENKEEMAELGLTAVKPAPIVVKLDNPPEPVKPAPKDSPQS